MKILLVSTYGFNPDFPSRPEYLQARALAARGHHVVAYEYHAPNHVGQAKRHDWLSGQVAVHRCRTWGFFSPDALIRMLLAERPDIVHVHHLRNLLGFQTVVLARRLGLPVVLTPHGLLHDGDLVADRERPLESPLRFERLLLTRRQLFDRLMRGDHPRRAVRNYLIHAPLRHLHSVAALSRHERELLIELGIPPGHVIVLPNAVDLSFFDRAYTSPIGDYSGPLVLFIGQLVPRKGFDLLAKAMPLVVRAFPAASFVFVSHNREQEAELRRLVAAGDVEQHLHLLDSVDEQQKVRLLRAADLVVAPSRYEGFGIPLIEAMAAECPVVTTDIPACNEIITHEQTGLLVPYNDHKALAQAIVRLLSDRALAQRLGAAGRCEVYQRYSAARLAADLEAWYESVLAKNRLCHSERR